MSKNRALADALVTANTQTGRALSTGSRELLVDAVAEDLRAASAQATSVEDRLAQLEAQMRGIQRSFLEPVPTAS